MHKSSFPLLFISCKNISYHKHVCFIYITHSYILHVDDRSTLPCLHRDRAYLISGSRGMTS
nr:MAG TPA: hypothetical protein [Caudoviricetes sp.]